MSPDCPADTARPPSPPEARARPNGRAGAGFLAALFTLLAWAALLFTGLGDAVGVAPHTLANKLAATVQHLQRHGGNSLASRAMWRSQTAVTSVQQIEHDSQTVIPLHTDGAMPEREVPLRSDAQRADESPPSITAARLTPRYSTHPSRAPPVLA